MARRVNAPFWMPLRVQLVLMRATLRLPLRVPLGVPLRAPLGVSLRAPLGVPYRLALRAPLQVLPRVPPRCLALHSGLFAEYATFRDVGLV